MGATKHAECPVSRPSQSLVWDNLLFTFFLAILFLDTEDTEYGPFSLGCYFCLFKRDGPFKLLKNSLKIHILLITGETRKI